MIFDPKQWFKVDEVPLKVKVVILHVCLRAKGSECDVSALYSNHYKIQQLHGSYTVCPLQCVSSCGIKTQFLFTVFNVRACCLPVISDRYTLYMMAVLKWSAQSSSDAHFFSQSFSCLHLLVFWPFVLSAVSTV